MAQHSNIDWTDSTWNPIRGCTPVSPGCKNCYAATMAGRFSKPGQWGEGLVRINSAGNATDDWSGKLVFVEKHLLDPLKWRPGRPVYDEAVVGKPKLVGRDTRQSLRIFVNSVSDLFHDSLPREQLVLVFAVMALCPGHVFQILTKRSGRLEKVLAHGTLALREEVRVAASVMGNVVAPLFRWPLPNVIVGVSVENQEWADKRREELASVAAGGWKTMVSYEPALGPVDWDGWAFLNWIISGGESGPNARPSHPDWHRAARDYAARWNIAYFMKQLCENGRHLPFEQLPNDLQVRNYPEGF